MQKCLFNKKKKGVRNTPLNIAKNEQWFRIIFL